MNEEERLIYIAEQHPEDSVANEAMKQLKENYDPNYFWCWECDGLVTTKEKCCLTLIEKQNESGIEDINFTDVS
jgi:hypothetical protein